MRVQAGARCSVGKRRIMCMGALLVSVLLGQGFAFGNSISWSVDGAMPSAMYAHGVVALNDQAFVFGGSGAGIRFAETFFYTPGGAITPKANMPSPRHDMGAVEHGGKAYSIAGYLEGAGKWGRTTDVWSYNAPPSNSWGTERSLTYERASCGAVSLGNHIYSVGGHHEDTGHGFSIPLVERYDPSTGGSWQSVSPMNTARSHPGVVSVDGKIYAFGGIDYEIHVKRNYLASMEIYDPSTDTWTAGPSMPTAREQFATAVLGRRIYAIGGQVAGSVNINTVEYFDLDDGEWHADTSLPVAAAGARAVTLDDKLYVLGGALTGGGRLDTVYVATPAALSQQPRRDSTPPPPATKPNLIVIAHGAWTADGGSPPAWVDPNGYRTHVQPVVDAINQRLNDLGIADQWEVYSHKWFEESEPLWPGKFLKNAEEEGMDLGSRLGEHGYEHIHLIGHSAGCALIGKAAEHIKNNDKSKDTVIHSTFLDAFVLRSYYKNLYGKASDWSDHYFTTGDTDLLWPWMTQARLPHAHNVDITLLDDNVIWTVIGPSSTHVEWPMRFYKETIPPGELPDAGTYGFGLSLEEGWWDPSDPKYQPGNKPIKLGGSGTTEGTEITERRDAAVNFDSAPHVSSETGTVNITGTGFSLLTGSPVWTVFEIEVTEPVNFMTFEASFVSEDGAEGLLAVYWDNVVLGLIDERFVLGGMQEYSFMFPETYQSSIHSLGFRLDPYTDVASHVQIDNVRTGYAVPTDATVIPEPLTMVGVSVGLLGLLQYIRKRK